MAVLSTARELDVVIERDAERWFVASVPTLRGGHTQAQLQARIIEAIELCLEVDGLAEASLEFVGIQRVRLAS